MAAVSSIANLPEAKAPEVGSTYREVHFKGYCPEGLPEMSKHFEVVEKKVEKLEASQVRFEVLFLSVDPYMRTRMKDLKSYFPGFTMNGMADGGGVIRVVESQDPNFKVGQVYVGSSGWAQYVTLSGDGLKGLMPAPELPVPADAYLGVLGMPSMTAYFGFLRANRPKEGETIVVTGAAGAVGSIVGQIAKIKGLRVIGTAGTDEKCEFLKSIGYDVAINYKTTQDMTAAIGEAAPKGVDCFFDNVGGPIADAVWSHLNVHARVAQCGAISMYNLAKPTMRLDRDWLVITKRIVHTGIMVTDYMPDSKEFFTQMTEWVLNKKIQFRSNIVDGVENMVNAFNGMMQGENIGKQVVRIRL